MSAQRNIYRSQVLQTQIAVPGLRREGKIQIILSFFRQSRFWHADPANFTSDGYNLVNQRGLLVTPGYLTGRDMCWQLLAVGVPEEEQPPILQKIIRLAEVADPELPIIVVVLHIRVCSLGCVDYQDIIDSVAREPIHIQVSPDGISPTATTVSIGIYGSLLIPASRSSIEGLKKVRFDSLEEVVIRETPSCAICIKNFVESVDELITSLPCAHHYHADCIVMWLKRNYTCPLCRYPMLPANMDEDGDKGEPSNT